MPVSKSKNRGTKKKVNQRNREELKRVNRLRGRIGNMGLNPSEAKTMLKALKDRRTPIQFLIGSKEDIDEILGRFNLITDTRDTFDNHDEFKKNFMLAFGSLHDRVCDAAKALDELKKTNQEIFEDHREDMEELGAVQFSDNWVACMAPIEAYDNLRATIEELAVDGIGQVFNDLVKAGYEAEKVSEEEEIQND